ncbi:MAG: hypothetical protein HQ523_02900 [Lentisphaerae bacterium]|nr:hypothetical protein [Lentisphaerota bacterium]
MKYHSDSLRVKRSVVVLTALLLLAVGRSSSAQPWTNAAGHAVEAEVVSLKGDLVDFERPDGSTFQLRLGSLAPDDRETIRRAWSGLEVPRGLRTDFRQFRRLLQRLTQLHSMERLTDAQLAAQRQRAVKAFKLCCSSEQLDEEATARLLLVSGALY